MKNDLLEFFTFENKLLRGEHINLQTSIQIILKQHPYPETLKKLLAESLGVVSLLSAMIKLKGRITLRFQGKGHIQLLLAQCNSQHEIRGLIKYDQTLDQNISYENLMNLMKEGLLIVMLEFDETPGKPYQGIVEWTGATLTDAIEAYFENSEQLLTRIWLHYDATKETLAGCMLQALPQAQHEEPVVNLDFFKTAHQMQTVWLQNNNINDAKAFLQTACPHDDLRLLSKSHIIFKCTCSRLHTEQAIRLLGAYEAQEEVEKNGEIIVTCDFCNEKYSFDKVDIGAIFKNQQGESSSDTIH